MFLENKMLTNCLLLCVMLNDFANSGNVGHFWHVTDLHYDDRYSVNGSREFMCWQTSARTSASQPLGQFGDYECDAPKLLVESAISAMRDIFPRPDFVLWTGDDTTHVNDSFFSTDVMFTIISSCTEIIERYFPNTIVVPLLGNHDVFPQNQISPGRSEIQTRVADRWKNWLDPFGAFEDYKENGRFVFSLPNSRLTLVGLNTLLWYESNKVTRDDPKATDPGGQFRWADDVLRSLAIQGRKVFLVGHIPPGIFERYFAKREGFHWYQPRYNEQYINLVRNHAPSGISAQLFGHHHTDSFRVFLSEGGDPISYALITPAVTPVRSTLSPETGPNNPGIRLIAYDTDTGEILEVTTYYLDLAKANAVSKAEWRFEYNLTELLNLDKISAESLFEASKRLQDNLEFFNKFYPVNTLQLQAASNCSEVCHLTQVCAIRNVDYEEFFRCNGAWNVFYTSSLFAILCSFLLLNKFCC